MIKHRCYFIFLLLFFFVFTINSQTFEQIIEKKESNKTSEFDGFKDISRIGIFADSTGNYVQLILLDKSVINAGDSLTIDVFLSGYGYIRAGKINITPNTQLVSNKSSITHTLDQGIVNGRFQNVLKEYPFSVDNNNCFFLNSKSTFKKDSVYITAFVSTYDEKVLPDKNLETESMSTESYFEHSDGFKYPPLRLNLKTKNNVPPGYYKIYFSFNYYDGEKFQSDFQFVEIKIMSWTERNEELIEFLGYIIAIFTIIGIIYQSYKFLKKIGRKWNKFSKKFKKAYNSDTH